jgi:membrane-anchored protein YejM (alkaline phosphatase superfamily)
LGREYDEELFQGESLLNSTRRRKYTFAVGNDRSRVSIDQQGHKILFKYKEDKCYLYDLAADPKEDQHERCETRPEQFSALERFSQTQLPILRGYSKLRDREARGAR